jgi:inhibitor of KinA
MLYEKFKVLDCGDKAILLEFGDKIDLKTFRIVQRLFQALRERENLGIVETVPSYRSLLIYYNPIITEVQDIIEKIREIENSLDDYELKSSQLIKIPIVYDGEFGPDLEFVADYHRVTTETIIKLHTETTYINCMYGFVPGFVLLLGLPPELETPRKDNPRLKVPAGSVGIGGAQTGVYPFESPGGWQLVGRTPLKLFNLNAETPNIVGIGDEIRFEQISQEEYFSILKRVEKNQEPIEGYIERKK